MPFQQARVWIHEAVHWLTGLGDVATALAADHRGATVYLTDRIISERGAYPPVPPRIAYANPELMREADAVVLDTVDLVTRRRIANDWHIAENRYMDNIVDRGRLPMSGQHLLGQDIAQRVTVRQAVQLRNFLAPLTPRKLGSPNQVAERVIDAFRFAPDSGALKALLTDLAYRSEAFRKLASAWLNRPRLSRVTVAMRDYVPADSFHLKSNRLSGGFSTNGNTMWINRESFYYFSTLDLTRLSLLRRLAGTLVTLFLNELLPDTMLLALRDKFAERGLAVLLENEILAQLHDGSPTRICAGLAIQPNAFLAHHTTIARAAASEDIHIKAMLQAMSN